MKYLIFSVFCLCLTGFSEANKKAWYEESTNLYDAEGWVWIRDATKDISGATFNVTRYGVAKTDCDPKVRVAAGLHNGAQLGYQYLNFGLGAKIIHLLYSNGAPHSEIPFNAKIFLDNPFGKLLADFDVQNTGGWCKFTTRDIVLNEEVTGVHHLYFKFSSETSHRIGTFNLQYFSFKKQLTPHSDSCRKL
ncbi:hypothetical protein CHUAL_012205 [Chamberlinius hualienensis]